MGKINTSTRLKEYMELYNLSQTDIIKRTGLSKSTISQWVNGTREPKQDGIFILAKTLDVSETWLMGLDVPMKIAIDNPSLDARISNDQELKDMIMKYYSLPETSQKLIRNIVNDLVESM